MVQKALAPVISSRKMSANVRREPEHAPFRRTRPASEDAMRQSPIEVLFALVCLTVSSAAFAAQGCGALPVSDLKLHRVSVDYVDQEIAPPEEIARFSTPGDGGAPHPLMAVRYSVDSTVGVIHRLVPAEDGGFCDSPETVVFRFGVSRRRVILAPQAAAEPCVKSALLAHEADHDRIISEAIRVFFDEQERELARQLRELKAQRARDEDAAKRAMEIGLLRASARIMEKFNLSEAGRIRELVDSPARLSALAASCNGRVAELERSVGHKDGEL